MDAHGSRCHCAKRNEKRLACCLLACCCCCWLRRSKLARAGSTEGVAVGLTRPLAIRLAYQLDRCHCQTSTGPPKQGIQRYELIPLILMPIEMLSHAADMECLLLLLPITNHTPCPRPAAAGAPSSMPYRCLHLYVRLKPISVYHVHVPMQPRHSSNNNNNDSSSPMSFNTSSVCVYLHAMCPYAALPYHHRPASQHSPTPATAPACCPFPQRLSHCPPMAHWSGALARLAAG